MVLNLEFKPWPLVVLVGLIVKNWRFSRKNWSSQIFWSTTGMILSIIPRNGYGNRCVPVFRGCKSFPFFLKSRFFPAKKAFLSRGPFGLHWLLGFMSDDAGREAWVANMQAQMVVEFQGVDQGETGGPAKRAPFCNQLFQPLPNRINIYDILYIHDIHWHVYIYPYIHTFTYIILYYKYLHTGHMVTFHMLRLYTLILTITIKDTFLWENKMILNIKIQREGSRS